jgi:hypothetical protein
MMNEQLQGKLVEIIDGMMAGVTAAKDFTIDQLPDVVTTYMQFSLVYETASLLFFVLLLAASLYVTLKHGFYSKKTDRYGSTAESAIAAMIVGSASSAMMLVITLIQFKHALLIWFAPKVYLIKAIAELIR